MSEKINLFALNSANGSLDLRNFENKLSGEKIEFVRSELSSAEELASAAISNSGIGIAICSAEDFLSAKSAIINVLNRKIGKSSSVISAMGNNPPQDSAEFNLHSVVPEGGRAYPSANGLYSAFSCPTDNGTLFFTVADEKILDEVLKNGFLSSLKKALNIIPSKSAVEEFKEHIEGVIGSGKTVAISGTGFFKPLISAISTVPGWNKAFMPDSTAIQRNDNEADNEYCARCAKEAKEALDADYGVCVSDITDSEEGKFVSVSVANSVIAKGAKIYAKSDEEEPKMLVSAALIKLCEMLENFSVGGLEAEKKPKRSKSHTALIIIIVALFVAMGICSIIAIRSSANRDRFSAGIVRAVNATAEPTLLTEAQPETELSTVVTTTAATTKATTILTTIKEIISTTVATTVAPTTAAPTTAAPTTTEPTTAAPTTTEPTNNNSSSGGKWVFRVYGWGHGVGMSQQGAKAMANNGSTYVEILENYYTGTTVKTDKNTPTEITYGNKSIPIVEYLCKTAYAEIGCPTIEALKAQIVSAYTFAKHYDFDVPKSKHAYKDEYDYKASKRMLEACFDVLGIKSEFETPHAKYIDYNGEAAFTCYFDSSAGKTTSSTSVWGGKAYPYLCGGNTSPEEVKITTVEISVDEMRAYIENYAKDNDLTIVLDENPEKWLSIVSHDSAVNSTTGYVDYIMVGDRKVRGNAFRCNVLDFKIRSHCFTMEFVK